MLEKRVIYGCVMDKSPDDRDASRTLIAFLAEDLRILLHDHPQCSGKTSGHARTTQGCIRTSQGNPGWVYRPCGHSRMGFMDLYFSCGCQLINKDILLT